MLARINRLANWFLFLFFDGESPIGLSVYEMYGRSESEYTLMGGETGRDSEDVTVDRDSSESVLRGRSRRPESKLRLLEAIAAPRSTERLYEEFWAILPNPEVDEVGWDCSEPILGTAKEEEKLIFEVLKFS